MKSIIGVGGGKEEYSDRTESVGKYEIGDNEVSRNEIDEIDDKVGKNQKMFKSKKLFKSKKMAGSLNFPISGAKLLFTKLR